MGNENRQLHVHEFPLIHETINVNVEFTLQVCCDMLFFVLLVHVNVCVLIYVVDCVINAQE